MKTQENPSKQSTNRNTHPYYHTQPIEEKINYLRSIFSPENEDECILLTVDIYSTNSIDEIINYIKLQPLNTPEERLTMIDILSTIFQTTNAINSLSPWLNTIKLREFINDKCKEIGIPPIDFLFSLICDFTKEHPSYSPNDVCRLFIDAHRSFKDAHRFFKDTVKH